jgi:hypothetical protein
MKGHLVTWQIVVAAFVAAIVLSVLPILSPSPFFLAVLARPGMSFSTILGTNDKWGLPGFGTYLLGNVGSWTISIVAALAGVRFVRLRKAGTAA